MLFRSSDKISGTTTERPELDKMMKHLRVDDTLVIWRLDRLGRSMKHLLTVAENLENEGIGLCSLTEGFDTSTTGGRLVFTIFGALAEFERNLLIERTKAGLASARAKGRIGGRPKTISSGQIDNITELSKTKPVSQVCKELGVSRASYYRLLKTA